MSLYGLIVGEDMDMVKKVVLFVVVLVIGTILISTVVPPFIDTVLERGDVGQYTGLADFTRLIPVLMVMALFVGGMLVVFRRGDSGEAPADPPDVPRFPWRRRRW